MAEPRLGNLPEMSVSDLSGAIKRRLEADFERVRVRGPPPAMSISRSRTPTR